MKFTKIAWKFLDEMEASTKRSTSESLKDWEKIIQSTIEAGHMVTTLNSRNHGQRRFLAAAPFLKRSLTDLRAIWNLIQIGYTSQAASIAASLYENALTANLLAYSDELTDKALATKYAEIPWGAKKLSQLTAKKELELKYGGTKYPEKEYEYNWTISYFNYKWLCQIKHPTWQSALHDVKSSIVSGNEYVVFPVPCNKPEDLHLKCCILGDAVGKTIGAIRSYCMSLEPEEDEENYKGFEERLTSAYLSAAEQLKKYGDKTPPVNVLDRRFINVDPDYAPDIEI